MINPFIILTGKTASGKDTVMAKLLSRPPNLKRVVTTTSRTPRHGEQNGRDYNFISGALFQEKIKNGDSIEYVSYGGNLYGTEKSQLTSNIDSGLIWRIDPSRAGQIREFIKDSFEKNITRDLLKKIIVIYLTVDDEVVLKRLQGRGLSQQEIEKRMKQDTRFWQEYKNNYDFVVENIPGQLDQTVDKIVNLIENRFS